MIVKLNNNEAVEIYKIIRDGKSIKGFIHGKKTAEFDIEFTFEDDASQAISLVMDSLSKGSFVDINSIFFQFKN